MKYKKINNINTPELAIYQQLRDNAFTADNSFIADSPKVVNMLLGSDIEVKSILATKEYYDEFSHFVELKNIKNLFLATKEEMQSIVGHKIHHNCMLHGVRPDETPLEALGESILMLDAITSTENVGSIARSAAALGVDSYLLSRQSPHPYGRRALRVSMGYVSKLKIHIYKDIRETIEVLKKNGYRVFAAEVTPDATLLSQVKASEKWALLMGHEGLGISDEVLNLCDEVLTIEMADGVKSFNVSVAASIMMYQLLSRS
ncbi:rRNA methyltransferase [Sulfurimonas hongkongensis]|uniref:rRNA methyltransferase n=1 Tax=Sulfurimonas hongkongensis TaxID=1172190 RepID=T0KQV1_9BACT|nr:RNA methyltransferase [Sulfurimonas hongkongensis]EQB39449.1 rRNA methyltransferase [Sulfurimonas hongkongensis]